MASVMDLVLESEESIEPVPNPAMRAAIGFAHYLRQVVVEGVSRDLDAIELNQWAELYGADRLRMSRLLANVRLISSQKQRKAVDHWCERRRRYLNGLDAKSVSYTVWHQRFNAWLRRNPEPSVRTNVHLAFVVCDGCEKLAWDNQARRVDIGHRVCRVCFLDYTYCNHCGLYFHNDENHYHPPSPREGSKCKAPMEHFRMPNRLLVAGYQPSDRIIRVVDREAQGRVSDAARWMISDVISGENTNFWNPAEGQISHLAGGMSWVTSEGNFPKRLKNAIYKRYQFKLTDDQMTRIGNIARQHVMANDTHYVEFTRNLDRRAAEFCHGDSCWFTGSYGTRHRCILKANGGMGMRLFDSEKPVNIRRSGGPTPEARAWVVPLGSNLRGVHDPMEAEAFLLFNAYGMSAQEMSALLASMVGAKHVSEVELYCEGMYVNDSAARLIGGPRDVEEVCVSINTNNLRCSCVTHGDDEIVPYPYDDTGFVPTLLGEDNPYPGEEEEPEDG